MIHTHMSDFFHASCGLEDEASRVAGPGTQGAGMKALVSVETHAATPSPRVDCSLPFMTFYTRNKYQARDGAFSRGSCGSAGSDLTTTEPLQGGSIVNEVNL